MKFRKSMLIAACAASLGTISLPTIASSQVSVYFNVAPPPVRYEAVPAPRPGYLWAPGYWNAKNNHHVWQAGHWERERKGYYYAQPAWTEHDNNKWQLQHGHWNKSDRDGDGVSNAHDRAPDNPTRH